MIWKLLILIVVLVVFVVLFRTLRPRLRAARHRSWEQAGLMPHQVDPHAPPRDDPSESDPRI